MWCHENILRTHHSAWASSSCGARTLERSDTHAASFCMSSAKVPTPGLGGTAGGIRPSETEELARTLEATLSSPTSSTEKGDPERASDSRAASQEVAAALRPEPGSRFSRLSKSYLQRQGREGWQGLKRAAKKEQNMGQLSPPHNVTNQGNRGSSDGTPFLFLAASRVEQRRKQHRAIFQGLT